jgi:hypothetical protein
VPIFWGEERENQNGVKLPYTEIRVGRLTLCFNGRPGWRLRQAVEQLEAQQAAEDREALKK